jgi:hypothetical protein
VGATVKLHEARDQVPPVLLLPTPPAITEPTAKQGLVALVILLQIPPIAEEKGVDTQFLKPAPTKVFKFETMLQFPPGTAEQAPDVVLSNPPPTKL